MFVTRYLATLLIGTVAIHYGVPLLQRTFNEVVAGRSEAGGSNGVVAAVARENGQSLGQRPPVAGAKPDGGRQRMSEQAAVAAPPIEASEKRLAPQRLPAPESSAVIVETVRGYTAATERIPTSGRNVTHWGVTIVEAPVYEKSGKRRDITLAGGTLVEQIESVKSSKGEMALCRVWRNGHWVGPWLIAAADLIRFAGERERVDADEFEALTRYYTMNAERESRRKELLRASIDANPHATPLRELKQRYDTARARATELQQQRDKATGGERMKATDELRRMKEDALRMEREMKTLVQQYELWKQQNSATVAEKSPDDDPEIQELTSRMMALRGKLSNFGL